MKVTATKVKAKELKAGDLFSTAGQLYWDNCKNNHSIGEKVYIRTGEPAPVKQRENYIYRITITLKELND